MVSSLLVLALTVVLVLIMLTLCLYPLLFVLLLLFTFALLLLLLLFYAWGVRDVLCVGVWCGCAVYVSCVGGVAGLLLPVWLVSAVLLFVFLLLRRVLV